MPERRRLTRLAERVGLTLALVGVIGVVLWLLTLSQASSERAAEEKARRVTAVEQCYTDAAAVPGLDDVLTAIEIITNNQLAHLSFDRLERAATLRALEALRNFHAQATTTAPTFRECRQLADDLGVRRRER